MPSLIHHTPKALSDSNLGHPKGLRPCASADNLKVKPKKSCSLYKKTDPNQQTKPETQRTLQALHSNIVSEANELKETSEFYKPEEKINHNSLSSVVEEIDIRPLEEPLFVYKTIAQALSGIKSAKRQIPIVCLVDIQKVQSLTETQRDSEVMDKVLNENPVALNSGMAKGRAKPELTRSAKKQRSVSKNDKIKEKKNETVDAVKKVKSAEKTKDMSPEKTNKPRGRKPKSLLDDKGTVDKKDVKKSPKTKPDKGPPEIVVTPSKSKQRASPRSSPSPRRRTDTSPKKKEVAAVKVSPKEKKRATSASPNNKTRAQTKSVSPVRRKKSPCDSTASSPHLEIPESESGTSTKRTRSPSARFKEDIILYPWDTTRKSPKKSPIDKTTEKDESRSVSPSKTEGTRIPPDNNEPKQSIETEKKTPSPKRKCSPRKDKSDSKTSESFEPTPGTSNYQSQQVSRALTFDADVTPVEGLNSAIPKDFKYKYQSSDSSNKLGLSDLITKVNSSIEKSDEKMKLLFGEAEELDDSEDADTSCGGTSNTNDDSLDSDKTVTEFNNSFELEGKGEEKETDGVNSAVGQEKASEEDRSSDVEKADKNGQEEMECDKDDSVENLDAPSTSNKNNCDINKAAITNSLNSKTAEDDNIGDNVASEILTETAQNEDTQNSTFTDPIGNKNNNCSSNTDSTVSTGVKAVDSETEEEVPKTTIFDMFGLKLKRKTSSQSKPEVSEDVEMKSDAAVRDGSVEKTAEIEMADKTDGEGKQQDNDDDVMIVAETHPSKEVIVLSDDEDTDKAESSGSKEKAKKPKFVSVDKCVEPKPINILRRLERNENDKSAVFLSTELEAYIAVNKENVSPSEDGDSKAGVLESVEKMKRLLENPYPDFDEIDEMTFLSFPCEKALNAHVRLELKVDWINDASLKKLGHLKAMKERQQDTGARRLTDIKLAPEQKQNYRGLPMRLMKYNKLLKQELEAILFGYDDNAGQPHVKTPEKTSDITKIKGWKNKFRNVEEMQAAAGLQLSESGKLHWRTEERLLKNLDPDDVKDIGIDLKKKRRKLVNFTKKKGSYKDGKDSPNKSDSDEEYEDFEVEEGAITEKDVYNEDDDKPVPDKIPYKERYLSQHKYGARKLFVKKMGLDSRDELILKKLGTQKMVEKDSDDSKDVTKMRRKSWFTLSKLTQSMAVAASSALNKKLINRSKSMAKKAPVEDNRSKRRSDGRGKPELSKETGDCAEKLDSHADARCRSDDENDDDDDEEEEESGSESEDEGTDGYEEMDLEEGATEDHAQPSRAKIGNRSNRSSREQLADIKEEHGTDKKKNARKEHCDEPGCRYGCICHLCKLSDSGEEKEADVKPPCDKEYCKLGCICDSIDTHRESKSHCRKPACMFACKCPPKQPKPDIPKERDGHQKKKRRGRKPKKGKTSESKDEEDSPPKEEMIIPSDDAEDWEPPSKRKRGSNNTRFANLPKRESTYRLAKNLDAVSRKAMEVYATSEMYAEQRIRRRKSDPVFDFLDGEVSHSVDAQRPTLDRRKSGPELDSKASYRPIKVPSEDEKVFEISDEESDGETFPPDLVSCRRTEVYEGLHHKRPRAKKHGVNTPKTSSAPVVIDLVESDNEDNSVQDLTQSDKSSLPSSSGQSQPNTGPKTVSEKMGLTRTSKQDSSKWKTQMVCLKAKKKTDDNDGGFPQSEIKLLEIISNCNWEEHRTNMLSKISHVISKGRDSMVNSVVMWQNYILQFLPQASNPAVIPRELARTLPAPMYSIRVRVTQKYGDYIERLGKEITAEGKSQGIEDKGESDITDDSKGVDGAENERKQQNVKLQKKLIDKIKFAEKLRDLIIAEEKKGSDASKFSVSLDGIQKALKKYKTQLWKAYTGSNNMTLMQLKKAVAAAKSGNAGAEPKPETPAAAVSPTQSIMQNVAFQQHDMNATLARITANQGLKIVCPKPMGGSFIPISNMTQSDVNPSRAEGSVKPKPSKSAEGSVRPGNVLIMPKTMIGASTNNLSAPVTPKQRTMPIIASQHIPQSSVAVNHLPPSSCVVSSKLDSGASGSGLAAGGAEVLLIPVPDSRNNNWNLSANPVLTAKMTMLANGNAAPVTVQNGTPVMSKVVNSQGPGVITMMPTTASQPVRLGSPGMNQAIPNLVPCQPLNGQPIILQTSQTGKPPIMLNAIQPVSSTSSMYNPVQVLGQSMKICGSSMPGQVTGTSPAVSQMPSPAIQTVFPVSKPMFSMPGTGLRSPVPAGNQPGSTMCSVYPIRLAPANTSFSSTKPISSVSSYSTSGARCINPVPVQLVPNKNINQPNSYTLLPVSSQNAQTPKTVCDSAGVTVGNPITVTSQSNLLNTHKDKPTLNTNADKPEVLGVNCIKKLDIDKNGGVVESVMSEKTLKPGSTAVNSEADKLGEDKAEDEQSVSNSVKEHDDNISDIINIATQAGIEIANTISSIDTSTAVNQPKDSHVANTVSSIDTPTAVCEPKDSPVLNSRKESTLTTDDESDSCLIIDEGASPAKQGPSFADEYEIALEYHQSLMAHKRKMSATAGEGDGGSRAKKQCTGALPSEMPHVTLLSNTEETDDIDVMSFEMDETDVLRPAAPVNRRKSQLMSTSQPDDLEIRRVKKKIEEPRPKPAGTDDGTLTKTGKKPERERHRRLQIRDLFRHLGKVVLKYNPKVRSLNTGIPNVLILQETLNLIGALKHKMQSLQECLDDGRQYQVTLQQTLQNHIDTLVTSGVPEKVISNFLKGVARAEASAEPAAPSVQMVTAKTVSMPTDLATVPTATSPAATLPTATAPITTLSMPLLPMVTVAMPTASVAEASDQTLDYEPISTSDIIGKPYMFLNPPDMVKVEVPTIIRTIKSPLYKQSLLNQQMIADLQSKASVVKQDDSIATDHSSINIDNPSQLTDMPFLSTGSASLNACVNSDSELSSQEVKAEIDSSDIVSAVGSDLQGDNASDDDEVRSSTGYDSVLDEEMDFGEPDFLGDLAAMEEPAPTLNEEDMDVNTIKPDIPQLI